MAFCGSTAHDGLLWDMWPVRTQADAKKTKQEKIKDPNNADQTARDQRPIFVLALRLHKNHVLYILNYIIDSKVGLYYTVTGTQGFKKQPRWLLFYTLLVSR